MAGTILTALVILAIVAGANYTMRTIRDGASEFKRGFISTGEKITKTSFKPKAGIDSKVNSLFTYLDNEGWKHSDEIVYVSNPVITEMLESIDVLNPLEFHLPEKRVGVYAVTTTDERVPGNIVNKLINDGFDRYIVFRNHVIGYRKN